MPAIWSLFTHKMVQPNLVRGFLLSRRERNITVNENQRQRYFLEERQWGQRKGAGRGAQHCSQVWALQLVHRCIDSSLGRSSRCGSERGGQTPGSKERQLHWWVTKPYKVKAGCCGWEMQNNCVFLSYKTWPICTGKGALSTCCISPAWANAQLWFLFYVFLWQLLS